ncbi:MAG TPA: nickel pincer cofactor biosynthesis protein LarC [Vicinamibacterales bacterium]
MARVMYFDCSSGAAGDMVLGALIDAGVPLEAVRGALGSLGLNHDLSTERVVRAGLSATYVSVVRKGDLARDHAHQAAHGHGHAHDHDHAHRDGERDGRPDDQGQDGHRSVDQILHLIGHSALSAAGKARASAMIVRLAKAEAAIHHVPVSKVHLHEVGAVDSIIDIVGAVAAFEWLNVDDVVSSPLNVGGGSVTIAHGTYPVPAPATLRLLAGVPVYGGEIQAELVTPTGALVLSTYATSYGPMPAITVDRIGYGAGTKDFPGRPNVLRVVIGERTATTASDAGDVVKIECEIDDMNPQLFGPAFDRLLAAGALDVYATPIQMKKGRPGSLLTVLGRPGDRSALCDVVFRETTTIGVRFAVMGRDTLERISHDVALEGGVVRIKVATRRGVVVNAAPEFDDCARVAAATGQAVKAVQADALRAWFALADKRHA